MEEPKKLPAMDDTFTPAGVKPYPKEGKQVEVWSANSIIKGYKSNGSWHDEKGTSIMVDGWRSCDKPKDKKAVVAAPVKATDPFGFPSQATPPKAPSA